MVELEIGEERANVVQIKEIATKINEFVHSLEGQFEALNLLIGPMVYARGNEMSMMEIGMKVESLKDLRQFVTDVVMEQRAATRMGDMK